MKEKEFDKKLDKLNTKIRFTESVIADGKYPKDTKELARKELEKLREKRSKLLAEGTVYYE